MEFIPVMAFIFRMFSFGLCALFTQTSVSVYHLMPFSLFPALDIESCRTSWF